jgi:type III pantothenate kinase
MLLCIDIGNTNTDLGLFQADHLLVHQKMPTQSGESASFYRERLRALLAPHLRNDHLTGTIVGSVVSDLGAILLRACQPFCSGPVLQVGMDWDLGLTIDYDPPEAVGIDRLLAAAAARSRLSRNSGLIVADVGTAITVDAVDAGGTFLGGLILPGLHLGLGALHGGTSRLPQIDLNPCATLLGRNTLTGMQAGALHGSSAQLDGLFDRIATRLAGPVAGFLTGGDARFLQPGATRYSYCDPALVLHGLHLAFSRRMR